ncbi:polysaccharide lyase family 7 protein [Pseudoalteromonas sp. MMG010]|uniref:polysaccharide lyase family 7 protein n=1 Tax=Pseudoalteromonas sp. MMG010 TaxID=2822685 RepID=UPI001B39F680|nr:polysaccharide lyase family 7 protein [Pseudoalteromonas sp. MMG010]MBQ4834714.1 polysaccharide lyase family 7 protein [Pseudoalteromonas sp. MMG010]
MAYKTIITPLTLSAISLLSAFTQAATFTIEKQNTSFSIDGNGGAISNQQIYLWNTNESNVNQQWIQIQQDNGYYSFKKQNTNLCWDGGDGATRRQAVTLQTCNSSNYDQHWAKVKVTSGTEKYRLEKRNAPSFSIDGNRSASRKQYIYLWDSNSSNVNQQWNFNRIDETSSPVNTGNAIPDIITDGSLFDLEGDNPTPLINESTLVFVPLETQYTTSGGGGWRHEYKIKTNKRKAMYDTYEEFSANYKVELSNGSKTIIAQHHGSSISTLMKLYVADSSESGFDDSVANNGIFDVYVRLRGTDGDEDKFALGTIRSGESINVKMINDYGTVTVSALGRSATLTVEDDDITYFKFGNYLQSQDPVTRIDCGTRGDSDSWEACYKDFGITTSKITLTDISYSSNH